MDTMDLTEQTFLRGVEIANGRFILTTQDPGLDIETQPHTGLVYWTEDQGWIEIGLASRLTVQATTNETGSAMLMIDPTGFVHEVDGTDVSKSFMIDHDGNIPGYELRCIASIGNQVFAGGVARQVYSRIDGGEWEIISPPELLCYDPPSAIQGIAGFSPTEVYLAGWGGELWNYDGSDWKQLESPTNIILNDICAGPEQCVTVGLAGSVIVGRDNDWKEIEHDATSEAFCSVRALNGSYYLSAIDGIYKLENDEVTLFRDLDEDMRTTYGLSIGPSGLWSVGQSDVALFDGDSWRTIGQS